jgi:hypothetical protein
MSTKSTSCTDFSEIIIVQKKIVPR